MLKPENNFALPAEFHKMYLLLGQGPNIILRDPFSSEKSWKALKRDVSGYDSSNPLLLSFSAISPTLFNEGPLYHRDLSILLPRELSTFVPLLTVPPSFFSPSAKHIFPGNLRNFPLFIQFFHYGTNNLIMKNILRYLPLIRYIHAAMTKLDFNVFTRYGANSYEH